MKNTIAIVDDHILIAQALKGIISKFENFEVIFECENGKELIHKIETLKTVPNIVMLDISMPEMNGFETALWLKESYPEIKIMVLSMQNDEQSVIKMIRNGAKSYLLKNTHPRDLEMALNKLVQDGFFYPDWASKIIYSNMSGTNSSSHHDMRLPSERDDTRAASGAIDE